MKNNSNSEANDITNFFGEVIHRYTRTQALSDGVLIDVSKLAKEAGWKYPTAITAALWVAIENIPRNSCEDTEGRLWDVLWMSSLSARTAKPGVSRFLFELILHRDGYRKNYVQLLCVCGPGDTAEPVITIGFPEDF